MLIDFYVNISIYKNAHYFLLCSTLPSMHRFRFQLTATQIAPDREVILITSSMGIDYGKV